VTPKGTEGLKEATADGKPMRVLGSNEIDWEIIGLKKNSKEPKEIRLVFVHDDIRFRRFSTTNQIRSYGFERGIIWGKMRRKDARFRNAENS
jgi:hypothetical protein